MVKKKQSDEDYLPVVEATKAVSKASIKGVKILYGSFFPSHDASVRREEKKLKDLERRIELLCLQRKKEVLLKKLEEME